ncbi:siderophore iron transporter mirB [Cordyceps militaris CM01]|uniref:Siderophore iron transporter mirB n=1 Tax=Cordyceps militaris (strain CM01) TaxID=983644 RepID=G3JTE0_CORMM|nr:siderophore iron transporter mirB [Cordyceps militaris CM01]EGX88287.1 siderophore iron transporter mirB [Cordyceps militaris CM01]
MSKDAADAKIRVDAVRDSADDATAEAGSSSTQVQAGVRNIEATTVAWNKNALIIAYVLIWLTYCVEGLLANTTNALTPFVTSDFTLHSLTPTVGILSSVIGGVTNLTLAKILDVFGRPQGYLFCIVLATVGMIMMAACNNVEAYAAAQVFQTVGNNGIQYSLSVFVADTSTLQNRGLMQAIVSTPNLFVGFVAGPIASGFVRGPGWRWAFGMFTIMVPCITLPLYGILVNNFLKAKKLGLVTKPDSKRTPLQSLLHYSREFDAIGLILLSAGVALFLLPFNLYTLQARGWTSPLVLSMLIIGFVLIISFVVWERFFAPVTFIPYSLLLDPTVFGACILSATLFLSYSTWSAFFQSYLQVVKGLSIDESTYVIQTYSVTSVVFAVAAGGLIHKTGRFKPATLFVGVPLSAFGLGLLMHFRDADSSIGYVVMCLIFIGIAAGTIIVCDEIAMLAAGAHQYVAVCLAVLGMFSNVGGAIGFTVASAIWQNTLPNKLLEYLPEEDLPNLPMIYGDINTQLSYPIGSATRTAIQHAYSDAYLRLLAVSTGVWAFGFVAVIMWRNINVIGIKQAKGHVW